MRGLKQRFDQLQIDSAKVKETLRLLQDDFGKLHTAFEIAKSISHVIKCPDENCCGCLFEEVIGDIVCNECGKHFTIQ